ncbi:MAG: hypothetical protein JOZ03_09275 [Gammaproteobacteria bacterium]|nr:hypothetical protein [Gammaproteobacteria bacterium]
MRRWKKWLMWLALCGLVAGPLQATPIATPVKRGTRICHREADARHLTGAARVQFLKQCHAARRPAHP